MLHSQSLTELLPLDLLLGYIEATFLSFLANVVPVLAPPTWIVLIMFKNHNPQLDIFGIAISGVVGTILGKYGMYLYCMLLGKHIPVKYRNNADYVSGLLGKHKTGMFLGSFLYAISPLPSNFLFISFGVSSTEVLPALSGFAAGRLVSYGALMYTSDLIFGYLDSLGVSHVRLIIDVLGIVAGVSIIFVDWKEIAGKFKLRPRA